MLPGQNAEAEKKIVQRPKFRYLISLRIISTIVVIRFFVFEFNVKHVL